MFQKILVALDLSPMSQKVFKKAIALAQAGDAHLMLLHVLSTEEAGSPDFGAFVGLSSYGVINPERLEDYHKQWQDFSQKSLNYLQSLTQEATEAGIQTEFTQTPGQAGKTVCALAQNWGADLILMGRRGHSGWSELIMGSVSNFVVHHAGCSVLIVQSTDDPESESE